MIIIIIIDERIVKKESKGEQSGSARGETYACVGAVKCTYVNRGLACKEATHPLTANHLFIAREMTPVLTVERERGAVTAVRWTKYRFGWYYKMDPLEKPPP